jgi:hypothetical protein
MQREHLARLRALPLFFFEWEGTIVLEHRPGRTIVGIEKRCAPPARIGKILDLPLSFRRLDVFAWPATV